MSLNELLKRRGPHNECLVHQYAREHRLGETSRYGLGLADDRAANSFDRRMLAIAYRPAWAGPIGEVPDHDPGRVASLPPEVRRLFGRLNTRNVDYDLPNRPDNMSRDAPGISPQRWGSMRSADIP